MAKIAASPFPAPAVQLPEPKLPVLDLDALLAAQKANLATLHEVATEISQRMTRIFLRDSEGRRPVFGGRSLFNDDPYWREMVPFHEYFNGDTGAGVGASHQTGWTALVAKLLQQSPLWAVTSPEPSRRRT